MMQCKTMTAWMTVAIAIAAAGCATKKAGDAVRVDAFDAQGHSDTQVEPDMAQRAAKDGVIFAFEPGDPIVLEFDSVDSDLVEKVDDRTLRVKQPFCLHASPAGLRVSLDGEDFERDVTAGSVSISVSVKQKRNVVSLSLHQRLKP